MTFWHRAIRHKSFVAGGVLVGLLVALALLSFVWTPHPATEIDVPNKLQPPSARHWLGTDSLGRDIVSQLIVGARASIAVGVIAVGIGIVAGVALGLLAAARRGWVEEAVMRLADFVMVLPAMYVALALRAVLPLVLPPATVALLLIGIFAVVGAPFIARGVRAIIRTERRLDYAAAAEALGASRSRLLIRHLLPAARGFVGVELTMLVPAFIVAEATLSYIGLGFPDSIASWKW